MPCPYANLFGAPGTGPHAFRIFGIAAVDLFLTILAAAVTAYIMKESFVIHLLAWSITGEVLHYVFGTQTAVLTMLGIHVPC
jgi:hypothetical protein